jgi:glucan 1,3-beta-glucosidase
MGPSFGAAQIALFPTLTQTGVRVTLAAPSHSAGIVVGNGWVHGADTVGAWARVQGCAYPE